MSASPCDPARLTRLLHGEHADADYQNASEHLEHCADCRRQLEQIAGDDRWWADARQMLTDADDIQQADDMLTTSQIVELQTLPSGTQQVTAPASTRLDFLSPPSHPEMLGRLGKYEIERLIGRGGMGIVLKGFDVELNRPIAIKVLAPHLASSGTARQRFAREARAAAAVVHENVIAIHGVDESNDLPYLVMPYVAGPSLQTRIAQQGPLEVKEILRIGMQIAAGLSAAHGQGLVHRDVKPANILLEHGMGRVLITDFGLARAADDAGVTCTGAVAGTPNFMSPEQANGGTMDQRSDLFSLGSVLYFAATGCLPFRAEGPMAVMHRIYRDSPRPVRELNADIPQTVAEIIEKLHEKDPADRFKNADQVRDVLARFLAHLQQPTSIAPPARIITRRIRQQRSRIRRIIGAGALTLALLAAWPASRLLLPTEAAAPSSQDAYDPLIGLGLMPSDALNQEIQHLAAQVHQLEIRPRPQSVDTLDDRWRDEAVDIWRRLDLLEQSLNQEDPFFQ